MSKPPRRRRMRQVVARPSYQPRATSEPVAPLPTIARRPVGHVPATPPRRQPYGEHPRALCEALVALGNLAVARDEARRVVIEHDERIRAAVARLHVAGASWGQIGTALGISRQGARQRFGVTGRATRRTRDDRAATTASRRITTPPEAARTPTTGDTAMRE